MSELEFRKLVANPQLHSLVLIVVIEWFFVDLAIAADDVVATTLWWCCAAAFAVYVAVTSIDPLRAGTLTYAWLFNLTHMATFVEKNTADDAEHQDGRTIVECGAYCGLLGIPQIPYALLLRPLYFPRRFPAVVTLLLRQTNCLTHATATAGQIPVRVDSTLIVQPGPDPRKLYRIVPELTQHQDLTESCMVQDRYWRTAEDPARQAMHEFQGTRAAQIMLRVFEETARSKLAQAVNNHFTYDFDGDFDGVELYSLERGRETLEQFVFESLTESGNLIRDAGIICAPEDEIVLRDDRGEIAEIHFPGESVISVDLKVEDEEWPDTLTRAGSLVAEATQEAAADVRRREAAGVGDRRAIEAITSGTDLSPREAYAGQVLQSPNTSVVSVADGVLNVNLGNRTT